LTDGNKRNTLFTDIDATQFAAEWEVINQKSNTTTGFSGTLFKHKTTGELVISMRSTEFLDDEVRDSKATNELEIKQNGWAFGQIADMESWYASLKERNLIDPRKPITVTGYSLAGHLATAFNLLHKDDLTSSGAPAIAATYTFNGAGVGTINAGHTLAEVIHDFDSHHGKGQNADWFTNTEALVWYQNLVAAVDLSEPGDKLTPTQMTTQMAVM
jgi:hypothetical protein